MPREKVFGIGLQRTGTRSLAEACARLGWKALHGDYTRFPGGLDLADGVYADYDMFCDTPFYLLYEKLDRRFPGSRFILTERDPDGWIESVRRLYRYNRNFENYAPSRLHHTVVYGTPVFDAAAMLPVYEEHNRRVKEYFAGRPGDLLVLDLTAGDGWDKLCPFLDREIPGEKFPHWNEGSRLEEQRELE